MSQKRARQLRRIEQRLAALEDAIETRSRSPTVVTPTKKSLLKRLYGRFFNTEKEC